MGLITPYWGLDGIILFGLLIIAAYLYMTRKFHYWKKRGVLEVPPVPFIGNFADCILLKKPPGEYVRQLYEMYKGAPFMGFYVFDKPFFLARDPELIKHILVKDFQHFADRYASADVDDRLGFANLFMMKNPAWKVLRTKLSPVFTSKRLKEMFELMLDVGDDFDAFFESLNLDATGKYMEMKDICANFTTDLIATTAYGFKVNSINNPNTEFRKYGRKIFEYNFWRAFDFLPMFFIPGLVHVMRTRFFGKDSGNYLRSVFWHTINDRITKGIKRNDLIELLIELRQKHKDDTDIDGFKFDGDDLVAQAAVFFTGGFETSSTTMSFALYELAMNPDIQKKARKEIQEALAKTGGKVTYEMITELTYLDMVVSESLRKYPPLPFLDRIVTSEYKVPDSDLVLEKGTPVYISMTGLHYDPEYFPNPEKFDPERFTEENKQNRHGFVYLPFGAGPHICIGLRLGLLQTKLGIIHILKNYEVAPCEKTQTTIELDPTGLTTTALGGLYMTVRKISNETN